MTALIPDDAEMRRFLSALFRYAEPGTYVSLRAFDQQDRGRPPVHIEGVPIGDSLDAIVARAAAVAGRAASMADPAVFAPPVATFHSSQRARTADLANGLTLAVEMDEGRPEVARAMLESVLGVPVTLAMESGGEWVDPQTGQVHRKQHFHWRLTEPTTTAEDHARLREARWLAAVLVGADRTAAALAHPLRWPGSWNRKGRPRMARIVACNEAAEIDLGSTLERLLEAVEAAGVGQAGASSVRVSAEAQAPLADVTAALAAIPNGPDVHWDEWNRVGMATWRATGGAPEGLEAWDAWSAKSPKYDSATNEQRWLHYATSPPGKVGAGTIFFLARAAGWQRRPRAGERPRLRVVGEDAGARTGTDTRTEPDMSGLSGAVGAGGQERRARDGETGRDGRTGGEGQTRPDKSGPVRAPLPRLRFDEIEPVLDTRDFVQGLLVEGSAAVIYGESNAGKTFWATDLSLHVAAGREWNGLRVEQGGVVYAVLEGGSGFRNRVAAWRSAHGMEDARLPFQAIPAALNLLEDQDGSDTDRLIAAIQAAAEEMDQSVKLVIVDTLSRALAGGNENSSEDMGALVRNMDRIRAETGACVLFIHHSGKDQAKGARGWSGLRAAIDTEIEVRADEETGAASATAVKQREMAKGQVFRFRLDVITLGQNRHGEPVTTCVVRPVDESLLPEKRPRLSDDQRVAFEILAGIINQHGEPGHSGAPPDRHSVPEDWWRQRYYERSKPGADQATKQRAFRRAADALVARKLVGINIGRVWVI